MIALLVLSYLLGADIFPLIDVVEFGLQEAVDKVSGLQEHPGDMVVIAEERLKEGIQSLASGSSSMEVPPTSEPETFKGELGSK